MLKKLIMFTGLLGGSVLFSGQALAAADFGPCTPEGGTHIFSATINKTVSDTSKNTTGATFVDFDSWNLGGTYAMSCECPDDTSLINDTLFKAVVPLAFVTNIESRSYYQINNNIAIASDVLISGGRGELKRGELFKIDLQLIQDNQKRHNGELFKIKSAVV